MKRISYTNGSKCISQRAAPCEVLQPMWTGRVTAAAEEFCDYGNSKNARFSSNKMFIKFHTTRCTKCNPAPLMYTAVIVLISIIQTMTCFNPRRIDFMSGRSHVRFKYHGKYRVIWMIEIFVHDGSYRPWKLHFTCQQRKIVDIA